MRVLVRVAVLAVAALGAGVAQAADVVVGGPGAYFADRAVPYAIFDYEPGIYMRDYWSTPWRARRFFPVTGKVPVSGREEDLNEIGEYQPAETFYREWSTAPRVRPLPDPLPPISK
ncbi:MAG: hypothetical protein JO254_06930 [Pseudolabrys sp.]|nr:hypothetical protein [Pseudolabrys sp.]